MNRNHCTNAILFVTITGIASADCTLAAIYSLPAVKDNTLLRYDPADSQTALNSNGSGNFFSAGRTFSRDEIRRGLVQFDLSSVPADQRVVPGSVRLHLRVIGVPSNDSTPRPFWVVRLADLAGPWGEGASTATFGVSGSGRGAPAQPGDATWFHTSYDPNIHNANDFISGGTGFWTDKGALGATAISDPASMFGQAAGIAGSTEGFIDLSSSGMENDTRLWLANPATNFGWIIVGDEGVTGTNASSKRDFATREHANPDFHPLLTFDVVDFLPGDYNSNGAVDAADYGIWRDTRGATGLGLLADGNLDEMVDQADYDLWAANFGMASDDASGTAIPEPGAITVSLLGLFALRLRRITVHADVVELLCRSPSPTRPARFAVVCAMIYA